MNSRKSILLALVAIMLTATFGCATRQYVTLKSGEDQPPLYTSNHLGIFPGPDNAISAATAYSIIEKTNAETALMTSYSQRGTQSNPEGEALGFIINDRHKPWDLTIKTKVGKLTIFQASIAPEKKLKHKLPWGEYTTVWSDGYQRFVSHLKVMPYADVRAMIKGEEDNKEKEIRGYWMTHLPQ